MIISTIVLSSCNISFITNSTGYTPSTQRTYQTTTEYVLPDSDNPDGYEVIFDLGNGETYKTTTTKSGHIIEPAKPEKSFANFEGWYNNDVLFDFSYKVGTNITLTAKWSYDYASLVNYVYQNTVKAAIKIETQAEKNGFISRATSDSIGSGIIIEEDDYYYYALTNNHVVYYDKTEYNSVSYYVYDCYNNIYQPRNVRVLYSLASYDLALIRFSKGEKQLEKVKFAKISKTDKVFTLGNPKSLSNAISLGDYIGEKVFKPSVESIEKSNVEFEVLMHNAFIDNGSSGGAVFNFNLELIGISFASSVSEKTGEFIRGYAIPIEKVKEFINLYNEG